MTTPNIPYSYYGNNGALLHCASAVYTDYGWGPYRECVGSTWTDSNSKGVFHSVSVDTLTESPVTAGNWAEASTTAGDFNPTAAAQDLVTRFYTAFSNLCTSTGPPVTKTINATTWYENSVLPGGAVGSFTTGTSVATYYTCDNGPQVSAMPWWFPSTEGPDASSDGFNHEGEIVVSLGQSQYTPENLQQWLWGLAATFAHVAIRNAVNSTIDREEGREIISMPVNLLMVPAQVDLNYYNSLNMGPLEQMTGLASFHLKDSAVIACEVAEALNEAIGALFGYAEQWAQLPNDLKWIGEEAGVEFQVNAGEEC
ncbi:uncharacterized protein PFLUO_LOCUS2312 [Penicillium psychrofluorescens]|uniref:uncharacterized protein n=1 Tax=Penicillium psychrofluorescens TaxID=3158075 RepID=UPI003CCE03E6